MQTGERGNITEAKILAALIEAGYFVCVPFGSGHKYDLVIDDLKKIYRVQCKTGRIRNGSLIFNSYSQSGNGSTKQGYYGLADLFAVLHPETEEVYIVPVEAVGAAGVVLRLVPPLSGQTKRINWARNYLLKSLAKESQF
ncbi:MAG: hypothetical protein JO360_00240 [Acidobacteria bacterium]|nr:hypothetical protein [Acidobacteriota bacterium]